MRISDWSSDVCSSDLLWEGIAADPASIPTAVEELLRWVTPLNNMFRTVAADCEVDGVAMRAGDRIALVYPSANRDEADRKRVVKGKSVSVRVDLGGRRISKKKKTEHTM